MQATFLAQHPLSTSCVHVGTVAKRGLYSSKIAAVRCIEEELVLPPHIHPLSFENGLPIEEQDASWQFLPPLAFCC